VFRHILCLPTNEGRSAEWAQLLYQQDSNALSEHHDAFARIVVPPYPLVIRSKANRGYVKPRIRPNAVYNVIFVYSKGKGHPITGQQGPRGGVEVQLNYFLTSALEGVGCQHHALAALPPGKTRYPLYRRLGGPHSRSGRVRKISPPPGFDPRTIQPVVKSLYRLSNQVL
jgi:hypothetical protein